MRHQADTLLKHICLLKHVTRRHSTPIPRRAAVSQSQSEAVFTRTSWPSGGRPCPGSPAEARCELRLGAPTIVAIQSVVTIISILARYCRDTAEILARYCRYTGEILARYWRDTAEILARYWRDTGEILARYCRDPGEILAIYCPAYIMAR